jgi:hypothetical protein
MKPDDGDEKIHSDAVNETAGNIFKLEAPSCPNFVLYEHFVNTKILLR